LERVRRAEFGRRKSAEVLGELEAHRLAEILRSVS
jgi:hypothetical protein